MVISWLTDSPALLALQGLPPQYRSSPHYSSSRLISRVLNRLWPIVLLYNCCWYKLLYICLLIQTTEGPTERIGSHKCKVYSAFLPSFDGWYPVSGTTEDNWIETTMNKKTIQSLRSSIVLNYKVNIYHGNKCFPSCLVKLKISQRCSEWEMWDRR